jgi:PAS domain S-box-containing protein
MAGLRAHLVGLVLAALLPALTVGAAAAWSLAGSYSNAFEARLQDTARALALYVDSEIETQLVAVTSLASSPLLERDDLAGFEAWARRVGSNVSGWVVVNDAAPGHRQLVNTGLPQGAPLPPPSPPGEGAWDLIRQVVETGRPGVSNLFTARGAGRLSVAVAAPTFQDGRVTRVVAIGIDLAKLSARLAAQGPSGHAYASVADGGGRIVARSRDHDRFLGTLARSRSVSAEDRARSVFRAQSVYGDLALFAARPLTSTPGWTVAVVEPYGGYRASWVGPLAALVLSGAAAVALGLLVAFWLARRVLLPVTAMVRRADATAAGRGIGPAAEPARVAELEVLRVASERAQAALVAREADYRAIFETATAGVAEVDARSRRYLRVNRRFCEIVGRMEAELVGELGPDDVFHPDERDRIPVNLVADRDGEAEDECRVLRPDGTIVWVRASASVSARDEAGRPLRAVSIVQDVTERRQAEEVRTLLAREVDHRAKNALSVVQAAVRLTPRGDAAAYAHAIEGRVTALSRAHSLLADAKWTGADLADLAQSELGAFAPAAGEEAGTAPRANVAGAPVTVSPEAGQALAMIFHELATNAVKHGALSAEGGEVTLSWTVDEAAGSLRLHWTERGGPRVGGPPLRLGFGTRVIESTVRGQLGGTCRKTWAAEGIVFDAEVPLSRVLPRSAVPTFM